MAIELRFGGWFECRLATDPDLYTEKRGSLGWTFAIPTEPDLDRIIRFQPAGAVLRSPGPTIGVGVQAVAVEGVEAPGHALIGAKVALPANPVFEGQNGTVAGSAREPIAPFEIEVSGSYFTCRRAMHDPATGLPAFVESISRGRDPALFAKTSIPDAAAYRAARRSAVDAAFQSETDPQKKAGWGMRKARLDVATGAALMWGPVAADYFVTYDYKLTSPNGVVSDTGKTLPAIDIAAPWRVAFSCGAWDADVLAGFVTGSLFLPQPKVA